MDRLEYFKELRNTDVSKIVTLWEQIGSLVADNDKVAYIKGTVLKVTAPTSKTMHNSYVYVKEDYFVDDTHPKIKWESFATDTSKTKLMADGIVSPYFQLILTAAEVPAGTEADHSENVMSKQYTEGDFYDIKISDTELKIILGECGVPFLKIDDLEVCREDIIRLMIAPALQQYYAHYGEQRPEYKGYISPNTEYKYYYPEGAYYAIAFYTQGHNGGVNQSGGTAFAFLNEQYMMGRVGNMGRWGGPSYLGKSVPGYTGNAEGVGMLASVNAMQYQQELYNWTRTEVIRNGIDEDGKRFLTGYSSNGGHLNIVWLYYDTNFANVPFVDLKDVRNMCKVNVLRNLGVLRSMFTSDTMKVDYSIFTNRADKLEDAIEKKWGEDPYNLVLALQRGGH